MAGVTLDAGALIAADRRERWFAVWWQTATERGIVPTIPAPVLAQVWRGGARAAGLGRLVACCRVVPMDDSLAKRVGVLCGVAGTSDIADAAVVVVASEQHDEILTSDPADITRLMAHVHGVRRVTAISGLEAALGRGR